MSKTGQLLVIEGPDFVGRSTHVRLLTERLEAHGVATLTLGLARSPLLGELLKRSGVQEFGGYTRALLYATDLHDQVAHMATPALAAGYVVVADRYHYTLTIREKMRSVSTRWLSGLYNGLPEPTRVTIFEASPRRQLDRMLRDSGVNKLSYYEAGADLHYSESPTRSFLKYQSRLQKEFRKLAEKNGWTIINTERPVDEVHEDLWSEVSETLAEYLQPLRPRA